MIVDLVIVTPATDIRMLTYRLMLMSEHVDQRHLFLTRPDQRAMAEGVAAQMSLEVHLHDTYQTAPGVRHIDHTLRRDFYRTQMDDIGIIRNAYEQVSDVSQQLPPDALVVMSDANQIVDPEALPHLVPGVRPLQILQVPTGVVFEKINQGLFAEDGEQKFSLYPVVICRAETLRDFSAAEIKFQIPRKQLKYDCVRIDGECVNDMAWELVGLEGDLEWREKSTISPKHFGRHRQPGELPGAIPPQVPDSEIQLYLWGLSRNFSRTSRSSLIVIDDVYGDPDEVRRQALTKEYVSANSHTSSVGMTSIEPLIQDGIKEHLERIIGVELTAAPGSLNGHFSCFTSNHIRPIQQFSHEWAVQVFLTPNAPSHAGITFYRPDEQAVASHDRTRLTAEDTVANVYNRAVIFPANRLHSPSENFGSDLSSGRLIQTFYFD